MKISRLNLWIHRWLHYEYWPFKLFYLPTLPLWLYYSIRSKSLVYISASNPGIYLGGFFGESKKEILDLIDDPWKAKTLRIKYLDNNFDLNTIKQNFSFPFIAKPDIGERGTNVSKINNEEEYLQYIKKLQCDILIQEFVDLPIEFGVLYYRFPNENKGTISSVTGKIFLHVNGDGTKSIEELMQLEYRTAYQLNRLQKENKINLRSIPAKDELVILEERGNHCLGTQFTNENKLINDRLCAIMDQIAIPMKGFYFGRFDLRCKSIEDLYRGQNIKIMEVNGATSEPGHIYDTKMNLIQSYCSLFSHMKVVYQISRMNRRNGSPFGSFKEFYAAGTKHLFK
ncbi:MAG TPA: hypothetical protein PKH65_08015 [Bacteroidia bacterium]|nr:hypothetical protein [Bacteroidia bacterium]